ncbi:MAG: hypothetical protein KA716_31875 [Gloeotrichia echinulata DEX184]|nr:hypothetical protein [Gloeotrichia echinulata DEX184]MCM0594535.1 hypothetical protein [Gloeotrichia echinulata DEX184]
MVNYAGAKFSIVPQSGIKYPDNFIGAIPVIIGSKSGIKSVNNYQCVRTSSVNFLKNGVKYSNDYGGSKAINQSSGSVSAITRTSGQIFP